MNKNLSNQNIALGLVALLVVYFLFFKKKSSERFDSGNISQCTQPQRTTMPRNCFPAGDPLNPNRQTCIGGDTVLTCDQNKKLINDRCCSCINSIDRCIIPNPFGGCLQNVQTCPDGKQLFGNKCCNL